MAASAAEVKVGGTGAVLAAVQQAANAFHQKQSQHRVVVLPSLGSGGAIKAVLSGALQLGLSARPLTPAELAAGAVASPLGQTPFVLAVATSHPATNIGRQQLVDLYSGRTAQWPDGQRVRLVLRPASDSDTLVLKAISPAVSEALTIAEQQPGQAFAITDQEAATRIERVPGAIGPTTLSLMLAEKRQLKALTLEGTAADLRQLAQGRYPLSKAFLLVTGPDKTEATEAFVAFMRSPAGHELLAQQGLLVH